jgi:voltage-gated potassium channel
MMEEPRPRDRFHRFVVVSTISLIVLSVVSVILGTVHSIHERFGFELYVFEIISVAAFTVEYLVRLWACTSDPRYRNPLTGRLRHMLRPLSLIDLFAILPFYLSYFVADTAVLRVLWTFRLLRILMLVRYTDALELIWRVYRAKRQELAVALVVIVVMVAVSSCLMFFAERGAQPDRFSDIPSAMWWSVVTITTVGYGDIVPVTGVGRLLGSLIALLGVATIALPTAILGAGFVHEFQRRHREHCPHCGKLIRRSKD